MDIGRSFSYVFEDQEWVKKVLIGGIINLIPIVNFAATGYWLEETKRVYNDQTLPLPEWDNFGGYFMKGLMAFVGGFIWAIPLILFACCASIPGFVASGDPRGEMPAWGTLLIGCASCLSLLYLIVFLVFWPALSTRYALTGEFGAFLQISQAWQMIQTNVGGYFTAVVVWIVAAMIAGLIGSILCGVGAAFTGFWASLVAAFLFGGFARGTVAQAPAPAM